MLFAYVYTTNDSFPIVIDEEQQAALLKKGTDALAILACDLEEGDIDPQQVVHIEVETGEDADENGYPDKDNPDTKVVYQQPV